MDLAKYIDHTLLKTDARKADLDKLLSEAKAYGFSSVCGRAAQGERRKNLYRHRFPARGYTHGGQGV